MGGGRTPTKVARWVALSGRAWNACLPGRTPDDTTRSSPTFYSFSPDTLHAILGNEAVEQPLVDPSLWAPYGLPGTAAVALSNLRLDMTNPDPICARLFFKSPHSQIEPLVSEWTPEQVITAKNRSAILKPLILYLQDDSRRVEVIQFLPERDGVDVSDNWTDDTDPTHIPRCDFEQELKPFLRRDFLTSDEPMSGSKAHMSTFCKCAWICRVPPGVFSNLPSQITSINNLNQKIVLASAPIAGFDNPPAVSLRPWQMSRDCGCHDDTCTCSVELAEICLWLGWKCEFEKHLRAAIWTGSIGSVDLKTPMKPLRTLRS